MKKTLVLLLALVLVLPTLASCAENLHEHDFKLLQDVPATCEEEGYKAYLCECGEQKTDKIPALGHDFEVVESKEATCEDFGSTKTVCKNCKLEVTTTADPLGHEWDGDENDYVSLHTCAKCGARKAFVSPDPFSKRFESGYTEELKAACPAIMDQIEAFLADGTGEGSDLAKLFEDAEDQLDLLAKARDRLDIQTYMDTLITSQYKEASKLVEDISTRLRALYVNAYESSFRDAVFEGWDEEDLTDFIESCRALSDPEYAALSARSDAISNEVIQLAQNDPKVSKLLAELVEINNKIAKYNGYANYYEYAYAEIYGRAYTSDETNRLTQYIDEYIAPLARSLRNENLELMTDPRYEKIKAKLDELTSSDLFKTPTARDAIASYLKTMKNDEVDEFADINELLKDGRVLFGGSAAAFTAPDVPDDPILYFKHDPYYASLFTVVHEFGHYVYLKKHPYIVFDYDLCETHSQGNEMLLLAFLKSYLTEGVTDESKRSDAEFLFDCVRNSALSRLLNEVITCERVDYFEYLLYTGKIKTDDYTAYISENFPTGTNAAYTVYVSTYSPCYYISYAASALPAVKLFSMACDDFDAAKESYFKLFTYVDKLGETHEFDGVVYTTATFEDILNYAGIGSPFEESFYDGLLK